MAPSGPGDHAGPGSAPALRRAASYWPVLVLLLGLIAPLILSTWYTFTRQRSTLESALTLELTQMVSVLADGMSEPIWNLTPELGQALVESLMDDPRVLAVTVTSLAEGNFLRDRRVLEDGALPARFVKPVVRGDITVGEVVLEVDTSALDAQLDAQWPEIYALGVIQGLLGIGVVVFVYLALRRQERTQALREMNRRLTEELRSRAAALRDAHDELLRKESLAVLGRLTATVSHEIRNPLGTISTSLSTVSRLLERGGALTPATRTTVEQALARAHRNIERCTRLADELLGFTRTEAIHRERTDLDQWLGELVADYDLPEAVRVDLRLGAGVCVEMDREALRRAIANLLGNAVQAMADDGGTITLCSAVVGQWLEIRVRDAGGGFEPGLREKMFEPLFSTRAFGFGLGLPLVKQVVEQHGGRVEAVNLDGGAEFLIVLPRNGATTAPAPAQGLLT